MNMYILIQVNLCSVSHLYFALYILNCYSYLLLLSKAGKVLTALFIRNIYHVPFE